jgi:hypothetical protein
MLLNLAVLIALLATVCLVPSAGLPWLRPVERWVAHMAEHRLRSAFLVAVLGFMVPAGLGLVGGIANPRVQDEFSYLLAADTFAQGRLTNPPHPLWMHFETMHVIHRPTYTSKYPPGQALVLAAGEILIGWPVVGVWLSTAAACAAVYWMLLSWLPPRWALFGGLLTTLHPAILQWSQAYWGGAVAVLGGALLLGGWRRLATAPTTLSGLMLALGVGVLANSRPFEGLILSGLVFCSLLWRLLARRQRTVMVSTTKAALAGAGLLIVVATAMAYYNWRVTGHALRVPYAVHEAAYSVAPPLLIEPKRPEPVYRHKELRDLYVGWALPFYDEQFSLLGFCHRGFLKIKTVFEGFFSLPVLQLWILAIPWLRRDVWACRALRVGGWFVVALLLETWMHPHYAAPALGLAVLISVQGIRHLRLWKWHDTPGGLFLARAALLVSLAALIPFCFQLNRDKNQGWSMQRARILEDLKVRDGQHLVIVRYSDRHCPHEEWVYNEADIDRAKVVWAREMGPTADVELLQYFKDRQVWLVEADAELPRLCSYPREDNPSASARP